MQRSIRLRIVALLSLGLLQLLTPSVMRAQEVAATECCLAMLFPIGGRAVALGTAITARAAPDAIFINPAAIANPSAAEVRVHSSKTDIEQVTAITALFRVRRAGTLAFSFRTVDNGDIQLTDQQGNPTGMLRVADQALLATFATEISAGLRAGVTYNFYDCAGACGQPAFKATTHVVDVGVQYQPRQIPHLELGAALNHAGLKLQVLNAAQAALTPARVRVGGAYEVAHLLTNDSTLELWTSADASGTWHAGVRQQFSTGMELSLDRTLFVRAGWSSGTGRGTGTAVGLGLIYNRIDVSVAKAFTSAEEEPPIQISFALRFK